MAVDITALDNYRESVGDNANISIAEVIDTYLKCAVDLIAMLRDSLSENDGKTFERAAHTLKSSSASVGASEVSALAADLEHLCRQSPLSQLSPIMSRVDGEFTKAATELRTIRDRLC